MDWKDIKVSKETHNLIIVRVTELTVKTGKNVTIKDYIRKLVEKDLEEREE